jgi:putative transposase
MSQSLLNIKIHIVFSTKKRLRYLQDPEVQKRLYKYISTICYDLGCHLIKVGGMEDHLHLLVKLSPNITISNLVRTLKANTSRVIKNIDPQCRDFSWQRGYGAFSIDESMEDNVKNYISTQDQHHKNRSFRDEFSWLLKRYNIEYNEKYLQQNLPEEDVSQVSTIH